MKKIITVLIVSCLCFSGAIAQSSSSTKRSAGLIEGVPSLSYRQMLQDFDSLVSYIKQVSPIIYFNDELRGISFFRHATSLRKQINPQTTMQQYLVIVKKTINAAQDPHSHIMGKWHLDILKNNWIRNGHVKHIDTATIPYGYKYAQFYQENYYARLDLNLVYTSGEYYNLLPFSYHGVAYPASMKLLRCQGEPVHRFVQKQVELVSPLRWDRTHNRGYNESFYQPAALYRKGYLKLDFLDKEGKVHVINIAKNDTVQFLRKAVNEFGYNGETTPVITHYFSKEKIFYARLPMMVEAYGDSLSKRLEPVITNDTVKAIVLDIRGNPGGSDNTYSRFLDKVIKEALKQNVVVGRVYSPFNLNYFHLTNDSIKKNPAISFKVDVATLKKPDMYYISYPDFTFAVPDLNSFSFDGRIYVLQDRYIYSSASNLSNLAKLSNQLVSIGETPDLVGGLQTNPSVLQLPHSKLIFRIEPQIDFTSCKTAADIFQNNVEHPVNYSIDELYLRVTTNEDILGQSFLLKHDPMFGKVLELEGLR